MVVDTENIANLTSSACALNPSINTAYLPGLNYLYRIRLNYDNGEMTVSNSLFTFPPGKASSLSWIMESTTPKSGRKQNSGFEFDGEV